MKIPEVIDLRSDTVTRPTQSMRQAMATCEVGDDVFGDDPTVIELERLTSEMVGSEASLWCATGTMANQVAIATHTRPGQEVVSGDWSHIVNYELGGVAWNSLCQLHRVDDSKGWIEPETVAGVLMEENLHMPGTGLVCLENTHNRRGGRVMPLEILKKCAEHARDAGVPVHLDGARIWNASTASGVDVKEYMSHVDSMMFCLSKGLGSPAGSMLCGRREFIEAGRRIRKRFGGGLRQAGVLACCGIISLTDLTNRLGEDHANAAILAGKIKESGTLEIDLDTVDTNICIFTLPSDYDGDSLKFVESAENQGVFFTHMGENMVRLVTHYDYDPDWTDEVVERIKRAVRV